MTDAAFVPFLVAVVAGGYLLEVQLPWRGRVPLGHALAIALLQMFPVGEAVAVIGAGFALTAPVIAHRSGARVAILRAASTAAGVLAGAAAASTSGALSLERLAADVAAFVEIVVIGVPYLAANLLVIAGKQTRSAVRERVPLYVVLLCGAALLAITSEHYGNFIAPVLSAIPLIVIRFSFERYARARATYDQAALVLGLLPELAGHVPLGHAARSAIYAEWLGRNLGFSDDEVARVRVAAGLHHSGDIARSGHASETDAAAEVGGEILREMGFFADLAPVVEGAHPSRPPALDAATAVVRVASTIDELVSVSASAPTTAAELGTALFRRHRDLGQERHVAAVAANAPDLLTVVARAQQESDHDLVATAHSPWRTAD